MDIYGTWELYDQRAPDTPVAVLMVYPTSRSGALQYLQRTSQLSTVTEFTPKRLRAAYSIDKFRGTLDAQLRDDGQLDVQFTGNVNSRLKGQRSKTAPSPAAAPAATPSDPIEDLIRKFESKQDHGYFPKIPRDVVAKGLRERVKNAFLVDQHGTLLCGPAAFMYCFASDHPKEYVEFIIDIYERGAARLSRASCPFFITPSANFRNDSVPPGVAPVDWLALGSLRDSTNWFCDYYQKGSKTFQGYTTADDFVGWLKEAGYSDAQDFTFWRIALPVCNRTTERLNNARLANQYFNKGYKVCLLIDADMLGGKDAEKEASVVPNHWITLTSPINISEDGVSFKAYSWRQNWSVPMLEPREPERKMQLRTFTHFYWGFVAGKP